mmetsp:Transcript_2200/g.4380  ORF Transcript_2200/g.4380 Transcript_2200/m.4380 type:complete len:150 (+) Transcript_2200:210-659(+)
MQQCWASSPAARPSFKELKQSLEEVLEQLLRDRGENCSRRARDVDRDRSSVRAGDDLDNTVAASAQQSRLQTVVAGAQCIANATACFICMQPQPEGAPPPALLPCCNLPVCADCRGKLGRLVEDGSLGSSLKQGQCPICHTGNDVRPTS